MHITKRQCSITEISNYIITKKKKKKKKGKFHGFSFIWSLFFKVLSAWIATSGGATSSFSLRAPLTGMVTEAKAISMPWEVAPPCRTFVALSEVLPTSKETSLEASSSFAYLCWLGGGGSWGRASLEETATAKATSPWVEGRSEVRMAGG